jgi:hypothetical protein
MTSLICGVPETLECYSNGVFRGTQRSETKIEELAGFGTECFRAGVSALTNLGRRRFESRMKSLRKKRTEAGSNARVGFQCPECEN